MRSDGRPSELNHPSADHAGMVFAAMKVRAGGRFCRVTKIQRRHRFLTPATMIPASAFTVVILRLDRFANLGFRVR